MNVSDRLKSSLIGLKNKLGFTEKKSIVINHVNVRPWRRESQNVGKWRNAMISAENDSQQRTALYNLYHDIQLDGYLSEALIGTRIDSITNSELRFFNQDGTENEDINKLTNKMFFNDFLKEAMNSLFWGHSLMELYWPAPGGKTGITNLVPRKHVKPRFGIVTKNEFDTTGINYREDPYWKKVAIEIGDPEDLGILLKVAQYVIYKRGDFGDWTEFAEVFGMPFRWATYNNETNREVLEKALSEAGSAGSVVAPEGSNIEYHNPTAGGASNDIFKSLKDACNDEMAYTILRNTMTTSEAKSSGYAQSKTHLDVQDRLHKADRERMLNILNEKLNPYLELIGYQPGEGEWKFVDQDNTPVTERINVDKSLMDMGLDISDDYLYERYSIPKPVGNSSVKGPEKKKKVNSGTD